MVIDEMKVRVGDLVQGFVEDDAKRAEVEDRVKHSTDKAEHREFLSKAEQRRYEQMKKMKGE